MDHRLAFGRLVIQAMLDAFSPGQQLDHFLLIGVDIRGGLVNDFEQLAGRDAVLGADVPDGGDQFLSLLYKTQDLWGQNVMVLEIGVEGLGPGREDNRLASLIW